MTTGDPHGPAPEGVSVALAAVVGIACFGAFGLLGLGMLSYFSDTDILAVEGLTLWPGIIGMLVAIAVFAGMLIAVLRRRSSRLASILAVGLVTVVAHVAAVWVSAVIGGAGLAHASVAGSQLIVRGSSLVLFAVAALAAGIAVALRRARGGTPKWPWERGDEL
ncbi:hypothetical protein [Microbacterium esteraromaticum]|uniref:hypothetical protein n=1 Tax=Microbacterium esteraromaticum TaxID=57043 RepID=UPI001C9506FC|nr:hypothetical protein [Microbacterium esteraromaticum]MBY6061523.1 hypothetical protein [Microbacterium esteraromaticum]